MSEDTLKLSDKDTVAIGKAFRFVQEVVKQAVDAGSRDKMDAAVIMESVRELETGPLFVAMVAELASLASFSRALNDLLLYSYIRMFDTDLFQRYTQDGRRVPGNNWRINLSILNGLKVSDETAWGKQPGVLNEMLRKRLIAHLEFMVESNGLRDMEANGQVAAQVSAVIPQSLAAFTKEHKVIPVLPHGETYITLVKVELESGDGWTAEICAMEGITFLSTKGHDQTSNPGN